MSAENAAVAAACFRPDLYRAALGPLGVELPRGDFKREGDVGERHAVDGVMLGPNRFFDGEVFDPEGLEAYLAGQRGG